MICEICNTNKASMHIEYLPPQKSNGVYLCRDCAEQKNLFVLSPQKTSEEKEFAHEHYVCKNCGLRLADFMKTNTIGCSDCFFYFKTKITDKLNARIGHTDYEGEFPHPPISGPDEIPSIYELKQALEDAVAKEEFEFAAQLRDTLNRLIKDGNYEF